MKALRFCLAALCILISVSVADARKKAPKAKEPLKVLAIGNSFSQDAVEQNLWFIADADGTPMIIGNLYIGGCSLERHWDNASKDAKAYAYRKIDIKGEKTNTPKTSISEALADEKWDVVTFQQRSPDSGKPETFDPFLGDLIKYVKERTKKDVRLMWHQTWAYETGSANPAFKNYSNDREKMFEAIVAASKVPCSKYGLGLIPAGTAVQSARLSEARGNVTRDGYHLNFYGRYIAALTWYEAITGRSVAGNSYDAPHVEPWMKELALAAAHNAVAAPGKPQVCGPEKHIAVRDPAKAKEFTLPDALKMADGSPVSTPEQWYAARRPELLKLFTTEMFGASPAAPADMRFDLVESSDNALGGKAVRKQVKILLDKQGKKCIDLLLYLPANAKGPVPMFTGINFFGNWAICDDPAILIPSDKDLQKRYGIISGTERGVQSRRWSLDLILDAGYGLATFYRGDVDPDFHDGWRNGIASLGFKEGQKWPEPDQWGTISQWAWGLSRVLDYMESDPDIDATRVAVIGHSRLGKTALWAGAQDERFALVISNCSGAGGASLSRRGIGENIQDLNRHFPHWFCENFRKYDNREDELPFDQHELLALIAPRPVYVGSASEDSWADPKGEFICALEAGKVYEFLGKKGLSAKEWIAPGERAAEGDVAYHLRPGKHDILEWDWAGYIAFADRYLK